jgi:hypothetical protein
MSIEKTISNLVESQFPYFLQEEGPLFIEFAKQYYVWMEDQNNALYYSRNMLEFKDIDTTVDQFLVYFKEKYLKNIQFNTAASLKRMVKHSLDLYRSKGTPRAIDLLFKVVFDTPAQVYLPGDDLFKLSSGDWYQQIYLEVTPSPMNIFFVGKQIIGDQSGATAFVERLVRKRVKNMYVEVFTISALRNNVYFITGEIIKTATQASITGNPKIIGSLTHVRILAGSKNFAIGDLVDINSGQGIGAKGRVTSVSEVTGKVEFQLLDGGFGYTTNAEIIVSEKVLKVSNVQVNTAYSNAYFGDFDNIIATQGQINYVAANGSFNVGDALYTYYPNNNVKGVAIIQSVEGNTTHGNLYFSVLNGNLVSSAYYTQGNAVSAIVGPIPYIDRTAAAAVVGEGSNVFLSYTNSSSFSVNDIVYQLSNNGLRSASGKILDTVTLGQTGTLTVSNTVGLFVPNSFIYSTNSNTHYANVTSVGLAVGIIVASPNSFSIPNSNSLNNIVTLPTTVGITPGATVNVANVSFTITGANSVGSNVNVVSTTHIIPGSNMMIVSGTGSIDSSTVVNTVINSTAFSLNIAPNTALNNATIRVWSGLGFINVGTTVTSIINDTTLALSNTPYIQLANATLNFYPAKFQFYSNAGNYIYTESYNGNVYSNATVTSISTGSLAGFSIANTLANREDIEINTDYIFDYRFVNLDSFDYAISSTAIANATNDVLLSSILNYSEKTIGTIENITGVNNGEEYNVAPIVRIKEKLLLNYNRKDLILQIANTSAVFYNKEILRQPSTGANGIVTFSNSSVIYVRPISFENQFSSYSSNNYVIGIGSGSTAEIQYVFENQNTTPMGLNAVVTANVVSEFGSVSTLDVVDSGVGYAHDELGTFSSEDGERVGTAVMLLGTRTSNTDTQGREGKSLGYYRDQNGQLSSSKKVHDGYYYQEFSYEVRSAVTLDKYEAMLKQLLHVAGTKYLASTVRTSVLPIQTTIKTNAEHRNRLPGSFETLFINFTADHTDVTVDSITVTTDTILRG